MCTHMHACVCACACVRACMGVYMHAFVCVMCVLACSSVCQYVHTCVAVAIYALSIMTFRCTQMAYLDVFLCIYHLSNGHYVLYCYRIYVGSINFELGEETVRNGFHQFGTIKAINMSWDGAAGKHKVFAYLVF